MAILGNNSTGEDVVKLQTPIVYLYDDSSGEPDYSIVKLATPIVYLYDSESEEPDIPEEPDVPENPEEPITVKLTTPIIELIEIEDGGSEPDVPEEPDVPDVPEEPTIVKLETPVIYIEIVEDGTENPEEPTIVKLATPIIKLIDVTDGAVKLTFDNYGYISNDGFVVKNGNGSGRHYSNLIAISDLANGPDGYCVQEFDTYEEYPKVLFFSGNSMDTLIRGFTRTEIGDKDTLTVEDIKALAATVDGEMYVAFNSDYEDEFKKEDYVYVVEGAITVKPIVAVKLDTPVVELVEPDEPTKTKLATPIIGLYEE